MINECQNLATTYIKVKITSSNLKDISLCKGHSVLKVISKYFCKFIILTSKMIMMTWLYSSM